MEEYEQTGYLNTNFRMFHLTDTKLRPIGFHYHSFHKILIVLSGGVSYCVECRTYRLRPGDIVFVPAGEVHRPIVPDGPYERIIIYISTDYLENYHEKDADLSWCLRTAHEKQSHVLRVPAFSKSRLGQITREFERSADSNEYAGELYHHLLFLEFMVILNRLAIGGEVEYLTTSSNSKILEVVNFLNEHLTEDITIDRLADTFYLNRYHLMHTFKDETGYTIGGYLTAKRLLYAQELIDNGEPITSACYACGFHNYSTFLRAYRKHYGHSPREQRTL
ncbi:MAG: AraC family transcriptional regulator [Blautia sp.]|nr:AraC family transcriptional regulator [Blautia sp.]